MNLFVFKNYVRKCFLKKLNLHLIYALTIWLKFNQCFSEAEDHLLHLGYHVTVNNLHVGVRCPHEDIHHHFSLLSGEPCWYGKKKWIQNKCSEVGHHRVEDAERRKPTVLFKEPHNSAGIKEQLPALSLRYVRFHVILEGSDGGAELWKGWIVDFNSELH